EELYLDLPARCIPPTACGYRSYRFEALRIVEPDEIAGKGNDAAILVVGIAPEIAEQSPAPVKDGTGGDIEDKFLVREIGLADAVVTISDLQKQRVLVEK